MVYYLSIWSDGGLSQRFLWVVGQGASWSSIFRSALNTCWEGCWEATASLLMLSLCNQALCKVFPFYRSFDCLHWEGQDLLGLLSSMQGKILDKSCLSSQYDLLFKEWPSPSLLNSSQICVHRLENKKHTMYAIFKIAILQISIAEVF